MFTKIGACRKKEKGEARELGNPSAAGDEGPLTSASFH